MSRGCVRQGVNGRPECVVGTSPRPEEAGVWGQADPAEGESVLNMPLTLGH
jgi:hypothetical protein